VLEIEVVQEGGAKKTVWAEPGQQFSHLLFEAQLSRGNFLCAGAGLCGKCRIRFATNPPAPREEEKARLSPEELSLGWRLACKHLVLDSCRIEMPAQSLPAVSCARGEGLAVDIGTTRIKWAVRTQGSNSPEYAMVNPQMGAGSEIMSRLRYALSGDVARASLRQSVVAVLQDLVRISGASSLAVAGNSTMISLLLDMPLIGLAFSPYSLPWLGGQMVVLDPALPPAYVPPLLGPFIGADISAGLAYISTLKPEYPFLLADLGTNGEFVVALDPDHYYACSVPMGPAIEGVGLCCGSVAGQQVLSRVSLGPKGLQWAGGPLQGISGTGYASVLALLRRLGIVDEAGHFQTPSMPLASRIATRIQDHPLGRIFALEEDVFVAERDIEEFLKAKAGVNVALRALVRSAGVTEGDLARIYLAGALGEHVDPGDLITLGFLSEIWREKIEVIGNSSLAGTLLALEDDGIRNWLATLSERVSVLGLVEQEDFGPMFLQAMRFAWD
jgi:uncharacterized 2Fe-2S/4Fe-4S cluster protein (DUF4445 family)